MAADAAPGYRTRMQTVIVDGVADLQIRSLLDGQQYWDPDDVAGRLGISSAAWPLFGMLWPSSAVLAARLALRGVNPAERILEIGCGLGLPSLVAHRRGANITASDIHPLAGAFLQANARINGLLPMLYRHADWRAGAVAVGQGDEQGDEQGDVQGDVQGDEQGDEQRAEHGAEQSADRAVEGVFDLIVGSDLLYERDAHGDAAAFIARHAAPLAEVWIVDPDRGNRPAFNRALAALGFSLTEQRLDRAVSADRERYKGRLLVYRRSG